MDKLLGSDACHLGMAEVQLSYENIIGSGRTAHDGGCYLAGYFYKFWIVYDCAGRNRITALVGAGFEFA